MGTASCEGRVLCCPACRGRLRLERPEITCEGCARVYRRRDGIPVLLLGLPNAGPAPGRPPRKPDPRSG